jgi:alcohol dehydrogenase
VTVNNAIADPAKVVNSLTEDLGADAVIEAVGEPDTFELAVRLTRPGATVANVGVHGRPVAFHLEDQWTRDITVTTGLVDTHSTARLLQLLAGGQIDTKKLITHRFQLDEFPAAYDTFSHAADTGALKVVLTR